LESKNDNAPEDFKDNGLNDDGKTIFRPTEPSRYNLNIEKNHSKFTYDAVSKDYISSTDFATTAKFPDMIAKQ
jgi:hypothetical protein